MQILVKADRVSQMEPVHPEALLGLIKSIRLQNLMQSGIRRRKPTIFSLRIFKIPRAADVVFCSGSADRRELLISVHEKFNLALSPPAVAVDAPCEVGSDILSFSCCLVQNHIILFVFQRVVPMKLRVEIRRILCNGSFAVGNLIIDHALFIGQIFQRDFRRLTKRHLPVAVHAALGIYADRNRLHQSRLTPAHTEKIAQRHFDRRHFFAIPVHPQDKRAPVFVRTGQPDMLNNSAPFYFCQRQPSLSRNIYGRRDFPALSQLSGTVFAGSLGRHTALSFFPMKIFWADRTCPALYKMCQPCQ